MRVKPLLFGIGMFALSVPFLTGCAAWQFQKTERRIYYEAATPNKRIERFLGTDKVENFCGYWMTPATARAVKSDAVQFGYFLIDQSYQNEEKILFFSDKPALHHLDEESKTKLCFWVCIDMDYNRDGIITRQEEIQYKRGH